MSAPEPCYHWHPPRWLIFGGAFVSGGLVGAAHMTTNQPLAVVMTFLGAGIGTLLGATSGGFAHRRKTDVVAGDNEHA